MSRSGRSARSDQVPPSHRSHQNNKVSKHHVGPYRDQESYRPDSERRDRRVHASNNRPSAQRPPRSQHSRPPSDNHSRFTVASSHQYNGPSYRNYVEKQSFSEKCSNLCSRRGVLQFVEITAGILVLICVVASYAVITGYTSAAGFGSFSIDSAYSPFQGTELQQVREMDMQYVQLRAPGVYGGVAFSLLLCALTIVFLILGSKPIHRVSTRVLFVELIFDALACIGYIVAVGLYLHFIKQVNSTDICKTRERLYAGRGYTWMNCEVQGGDAAVAIFGLIASCVYLPSAILCGLYIKTVQDFKRNHLSHEYPPYSYNDHERPVEDSKEACMIPSTLV
ncbi:MARVEL domain-containing protein 3-like [Bombina bombina]|uniref:MARVEL domain-containing protein 3-like n=1 Tax=Bombina bombina TaxID=8345 RepID=UPI00235A79C2|nr:MARVEL domain-containing protein 3-like [Bombina bombina]